MPDISLIASALTSIKTATDFARLIKESSTTLKDAEVKLQLAGLISALADTKVSIADIKTELIDKNAEIDDLKKQLEMKAKFVFKKPFYFQEGDQYPFCPKCWEDRGKGIHMSGPDEFAGRTAYKCPVCAHMEFTKRRDISTDDIVNGISSCF
nr:hypothetical protein [uncultured Desulfobacter sp.]